MLIFKILYSFLSNKNIFQILFNCKNLHNFLIKIAACLFFEKNKHDKNFHIYEIHLTRCFLSYCIFKFLFFFKLYLNICINNDKILCGYKIYTKSLEHYIEKKNFTKHFCLVNFFLIKTTFFSINYIVGNLVKMNFFYFADISNIFFRCLKIISSRVWFIDLNIISHVIYYEKKKRKRDNFLRRNGFKIYFILSIFFSNFLIDKKIKKEFLQKFNLKKSEI
nr:hypothetical protein CparaKRNrm1_p049 [Cryptomonas paramecium]